MDLEGRAPRGSLIEVDGTQLRVDTSGRFRLRAPSAREAWTIRIVRPKPWNALVFRVQVLQPPTID